MSQKKTGLLRLVQEPHHNSTFMNDIWQRGLLFSYLLIIYLFIYYEVRTQGTT